MAMKAEWMKSGGAVHIPDPGTPFPVPLTPDYEFGKEKLLPTPIQDNEGNPLYFKEFDDQTAHQSPQGEPAGALLWTFRDVSVTAYRDIPAVFLRFMIDPVYGAGANYFLIVGLYDKAGPVRRHVGLWDQRLGQKNLWQPSCAYPYPQAHHFVYAATITVAEFNDLGNITWGTKLNVPTGKWGKC